jgi:hypothetical protein
MRHTTAVNVHWIVPESAEFRLLEPVSQEFLLASLERVLEIGCGCDEVSRGNPKEGCSAKSKLCRRKFLPQTLDGRLPCGAIGQRVVRIAAGIP